MKKPTKPFVLAALLCLATGAPASAQTLPPPVLEPPAPPPRIEERAVIERYEAPIPLRGRAGARSSVKRDQDVHEVERIVRSHLPGTSAPRHPST